MTRILRRVSAFVAVFAVAAVVVLPASTASADSIRAREYWLSSYGIEQAWQTTKGAGVTVAVIDTGIDGTVPELQGAVSGGVDFSGQGSADGEKPVDTDSSHGTLVASLLAGRGTASGGGVIGVAPEAKLLSISVGFGDTAVDPDDQIAKAVTWAVDHGASVINMSLTRNTLDWPVSWDKAFLYAMQHDVVIVAAAGNRGSGTTEVGAPATMPGVLTVAGVDQSGNASDEASSQGITIGVSAPSEDLVGVGPGGGYFVWQGTSGATPIVAGIAALVRSAHPDLDANDVIKRIVATATPKSATVPDPNYGYGLVNAAAAVSTDVPHVTTNPMGDLSAWIALHRRAASTAAPSVTSPVGSASPPSVPPSSVVNTAPQAGQLPTATLVTHYGIPLTVYSIFGAAFLAVVIGAVRQYRRVHGRH